MLRRLGLCLCLSIALSASAAFASPMGDENAPDQAGQAANLPVEGVVTNPDWLRKPSGDDMANFYLPLAQMFWLSGRAMIDCTVTAQGALSDCSVGGETPTGVGFGQAALGVSSLFRMKPQTLDGAPVGGAKIRVPIRFVTPPPEPAPVATANGAPATDAALALSRQLETTTTNSYSERVKATVDTYRKYYAAQGVTQEQSLAFDDLEKAYIADLPNVRERYAQAYAKVFSETELKTIVDFMDSPTGKAWVARSAQIQMAQRADDQAESKAMILRARALLCGQITCAPDVTAPPPAAGK
jgi:TonB family protein